MSTDWHIYCRTCDSEHPFNDANHQVEMMRDIIRAAPWLAALGRGWPIGHVHTVELTTPYGNIDPTWFTKHFGSNHQLVPRSEYGQIDGTCGEWMACACGSKRPCVRERDHEGPHAMRPVL